MHPKPGAHKTLQPTSQELRGRSTTRRRAHGHSFCAHELHPLCPTSPRGETPKATLGPLVALSSSSSRVSSIVPMKAGKDGESSAVKPQTSLRRFSILPNSLSSSRPALLSVQWVRASRIQSSCLQKESAINRIKFCCYHCVIIITITNVAQLLTLLIGFSSLECGCFLGFLLSPSSTHSSWES